MYTSTSSVFAVNHQARCLTAQKGAKERHRFLVGTCSLHESNELSVVEYREDSNTIDCPAVYTHPEQIWGLESAPGDSSLAVTSWQSLQGERGTSLWRLPHQTEKEIEESEPGAYIGEQLPLNKLCDFDLSLVKTGDSPGPCASSNIRWHASKDIILLADNRGVSTWDLCDGEVKLQSSLAMNECTEGNVLRSLLSGAISWDPHSSYGCAVGYNSTLSLVDTRHMKISDSNQNAHQGTVRDIDYNPNKPLTLITSGDDRSIRIWDLRNMKTCIKTLKGHTHWVHASKFNPFHDQLMLSSGSDNAVRLWRIASCSSSPWIGNDDLDTAATSDGPAGVAEKTHEGDNDGDASDPPDVMVRHMDQHEDSVYNVAWSACDAWIYCSLSFDGRIMVNHVPSTEKYKILL